MLIVVALAAGALFGFGAYKLAALHSRTAPSPELPVPERNPQLPTRTDRWVMENEHILYPDRSFDHIGCRVCGPGPLGRNELPSNYDHVYYRDALRFDDYGQAFRRSVKVSNPSLAELVSSEIEGHPGWHTLMLDIDAPARLIESSTPGHFHLYVDVPMRWGRYRRLLGALANAGVIESGYRKASVSKKATHLRPPWVEKDQAVAAKRGY